jgi:serine/threonine protein kinase
VRATSSTPRASVAPPPPPLGVVFRSTQAPESELAASIFTDGVRRRAAGLQPTIADYLNAIPGLASRPVALDAAIGVCIGRSDTPLDVRTKRAEIERAKHPDLAAAIDLALCLDELVGHTTARDLGIPQSFRPARAPDDLPAIPDAVGPLLDDASPRYRIIRVIGRGARSVVCEAHDRWLGDDANVARVAVKLYFPVAGDPSAYARTIEEARTLRVLDHPGIVRVHDVGRDTSLVYIVEEHLAGQTMHAWRDALEARPSVHAVVAMLRDIARAVAAVHAAGVVHRDLKPANVIVTGSGDTKVIDFGASRRRADRSDPASRDDRSGGTLGFMSREQFRNDPLADAPAADVYSLGAMLFWAIVGDSPHGRSTISAIAALSTGDFELHPELRLHRLRICPRLRAIVLRALEPNLARRYTSADAFAADLDLWLRRQPIPWQRSGLLSRARLHLRRNRIAHLVGATLVATAVAGTLGWISALKHAQQVREADMQAEFDRTQLEAEQQWQAQATQQLADLLSTLKTVKNQGLPAEVLTSLWVLEWVQGPALLDRPSDLGLVWNARIEVLEREYAKARAMPDGSTADTVAAHILSPSLALWYIRAGRAADAEALLVEAESFWSTRAGPSDHWLRDIRALACAARLQKHLDAVRAVSHPAQPSQQLCDAATAELVVARDMFGGYPKPERAAPIPRLLWELLSEAHRKPARKSQ